MGKTSDLEEQRRVRHKGMSEQVGLGEWSAKLPKDLSNLYSCVIFRVIFPSGGYFDRWQDHPEYPFNDEY